MKKTEDTLFDKFMTIIKNENIKKLESITKNGIWFIAFFYIIGTTTLLLRNLSYNLPMETLSIVQLAVITVYVSIVFILYLIIEYLYTYILEIIKNKKISLKVIICTLLFTIFIVFFIFCIFFILTNSIKKASSLTVTYYLFIPTINIIINNKDITSVIITVGFTMLIVLNIPMSLGGLKGEKVTYIDYENNKPIEYTYYGNNNGLYQFISKKEVILIPIEKGYIRYSTKR